MREFFKCYLSVLDSAMTAEDDKNDNNNTTNNNDTTNTNKKILKVIL